MEFRKLLLQLSQLAPASLTTELVRFKSETGEVAEMERFFNEKTSVLGRLNRKSQQTRDSFMLCVTKQREQN